MSVIHDVKNVMIQEIDLIEKRLKSKNQFTGVPTGFANLDSMTSGFQNSDLIILGARPSIGKTAMALSMMQHISLDRKIPCGFFSLEMSTELIGMRILAQESRVSMSKIRSGMIKLDEIQKIIDNNISVGISSNSFLEELGKREEKIKIHVEIGTGMGRTGVCLKELDEFLDVTSTLRASFYFYNTYEEIDQFIEVVKKGDDFLDAFFG